MKHWRSEEGMKESEADLLARLTTLQKENITLKAQTEEAEKADQPRRENAWTAFCERWKPFVEVGILEPRKWRRHDNLYGSGEYEKTTELPPTALWLQFPGPFVAVQDMRITEGYRLQRGDTGEDVTPHDWNDSVMIGLRERIKAIQSKNASLGQELLNLRDAARKG